MFLSLFTPNQTRLIHWLLIVGATIGSPAFAQNCSPSRDDGCNDHDVCTIDWCDCPNGVPPCFCAHEPYICQDAFAPCNNIWCVHGEGAAAGCHHDPIVCEDGDWCTNPDICVPGVGCVFQARPCGDNSVCTDDFCDGDNFECVHDQIICDDDDLCNGIETCDPLEGCQSGMPLECDDGDQCTDDSCDPEMGCRHLDVSDTCDDTNPCTVDRCDPLAGCVYEPLICDDQDECTKDLLCDVQTGLCGTDCYRLENDPPAAGMPIEDDHTFAGTNATVTSLSIKTEIYTTRYAGATIPGTHKLNHVAARVAAGVLGSHAELTIEAYHVNCAAPGDCQVDNTVLFNGNPVDRLDPDANPFPSLIGPCGDSRPSTFLIPIEQVNFPDSVGVDGAPPVPASNLVEIQFAEPDGCRSLSYASLKIHIMSPVILVHGYGSSEEFFDRQGLTSAWDSLGQGAIPMEWNRLPHQRIDMPPGTRSQCAAWLADDLDDPQPKVPNLRDIAREFGVDSVHIVAHGSGGLAVREYLQDRYHSQRYGSGGPFQILSLTTMGTPHDGTPAADLLATQRAVADGDLDLYYVAFPTFASEVAILLGADQGTPDQTTPAAISFNSVNLNPLPDDVIYTTVGGNADGNGNGHLDAEPDEWSTMRQEEPSLAQAAADVAFRLLRTMPSMTIGLDVVPGTVNVVQAYVLEEPSTVSPANDAVVPVVSAHGRGGFADAVSKTGGWNQTVDANHASLGRPPVAALIAQRLRTVDQVLGDLR